MSTARIQRAKVRKKNDIRNQIAHFFLDLAKNRLVFMRTFSQICVFFVDLEKGLRVIYIPI